jgi:hypothetical protein
MVVLLMLLGNRPLASQAPTPLASWVELGDQRFLVRTLTTASTCPPLQLNQQAIAMVVHAQPTKDFPLLTCEIILPPDVAQLSINNQSLPLPPQSPTKIAVLGDTGCRLKGQDIQACNDPSAWPFAQISQAIAAYQPDLIIHTGDYHYRETPCPADNPGCSGSPYGDNWDTWQADFIDPAQPLFASAPLVVVRGNHESCFRAGQGWLHLLDPGPYQTCRLQRDTPLGKTVDTQADFSPPYDYGFKNLQLAVFDDSLADDTPANLAQVERYRPQLAKLNTLLEKSQSKKTWLLVHRPLWGLTNSFETQGTKHAFLWLNQTLETAIAPWFKQINPDEKGGLKQIQAILSGHIHLFEHLPFSSTQPLPAQWVIGNGGTQLDAPILSNVDGRFNPTLKQPVGDGEISRLFGFTTWEQQPDQSWLVSSRDRHGDIVQQWLTDSPV